LKILITGIKGFLGKNLLNSLKKHELFGLGSKEEIIEDIHVFNSNELELLNLEIDIVIMCHAAVASGDTIISNDILYNVNVSLTEKIVSKFKNAFFVYVSTVSVYDPSQKLINEHANINPQSNYSLSKLWGERVVLLSKRAAVLRISSMFGIGMKENTIIPNYVNQAFKTKKIMVWGNGERRQNYIHVHDVVNYINLIIKNQEMLYGEILLGVSKNEYSNIEIAKIISEETNTVISFVNEDNSKSVCYNNDYSTNLLKWTSKEEFQKRLQKYIEWKQKKY
jgi:UDP-glucose 4-epimerase